MGEVAVSMWLLGGRKNVLFFIYRSVLGGLFPKTGFLVGDYKKIN
jgi:hypothetical protein